mmetsp:Transcript_39426/g.63140  ORF Transcript_39426/g.63140 Transcript_39426/m.63140 type:complete len:696 (-) Transcript_39426:17-2104(-)|eukprot:CAMPEP_0169180494 /NCGR_PEP_ID=MMETSP1015-20121227/68207_1 /TAXON_ID=342587 /ORGANISM="Karlodinium micrum, Strain CCMP2283" /LENGTH=695 /DNA_ID=CAMNT_0009255619 /DNA_START=40 /DNA_END=2127 /DNA_ORIENTATION=+
MACARLILFASVGISYAAQDAITVTPLEKVVVLLKKLSVQLSEEGKKEAAEYDKYACFCKEQADQKLYAVEKSEKKITFLKAEMDELGKSINALNGEITDLGKKIGDYESEISSATSVRDGEFETYQKNAKDIDNAISACERAIEAMKTSKGNIDGKVDFAQIVAGSSLLKASLIAANAKQSPHGYEYQSNDIIAVLESLLIKFKQQKVNHDTSEFDAKAAFDSKVLGLNNLKDFAEKEKTEKEAIVEYKTEKEQEAKEDRSSEEKAKDADNEFIKTLSADCETKAKDFDQRSKTRADEITAITTAVEDLEKNAIGNYKVNKKLTDISIKQRVVGVPKAPSFLQLRGSPQKASLLAKVMVSSSLQTTQHVLDLVLKKSEASHSGVLSSLAMKLTLLQQGAQGDVDHFVKVRALIKDLLGKLEEDAKSEASTKAYCDQHLAKQAEARDDAQLTIEDTSGQIETKTAQKNEVAQEIAQLQSRIAENMKALKELEELRADEKARNEESLKMSEEGKASVEFALQTLKEFYDNALIQKSAKYTPPNSDRSGNTVGDLAPKTSWEGEYHGDTAASKGILGILEVIAADFARTEEQVKKDEQASEDDFETNKKLNEDDTAAKEKTLKEKEKKLTDLKDELVSLADDKKAAEKALANAEATLEDLKKMCIAGEETYEERVSKRQDEIEALKEALEILENWKA